MLAWWLTGVRAIWWEGYASPVHKLFVYEHPPVQAALVGYQDAAQHRDRKAWEAHGSQCQAEGLCHWEQQGDAALICSVAGAGVAELMEGQQLIHGWGERSHFYREAGQLLQPCRQPARLAEYG